MVTPANVYIRYGRRVGDGHSALVIASGAVMVIRPSDVSSWLGHTHPAKYDDGETMAGFFWKGRSTASPTGTRPSSCMILTIATAFSLTDYPQQRGSDSPMLRRYF